MSDTRCQFYCFTSDQASSSPPHSSSRPGGNSTTFSRSFTPLRQHSSAEPEILAARAWTLDGTTRVLAVNPTQQPMHATLKLSDGRTLVYDLPPLGVSLKPLR